MNATKFVAQLKQHLWRPTYLYGRIQTTGFHGLHRCIITLLIIIISMVWRPMYSAQCRARARALAPQFMRFAPQHSVPAHHSYAYITATHPDSTKTSNNTAKIIADNSGRGIFVAAWTFFPTPQLSQYRRRKTKQLTYRLFIYLRYVY